MSRHKEWWVTSKRMTVWVQTRWNIITDAAPIVKCFIGQPLDNLLNWLMKSTGDVKYRRIDNVSDARQDRQLPAAR